MTVARKLRHGLFQVGDGVRSLRVGDHVVPARVGLGVWRSDGYHRETDLVAIDNTLPLEASATIQVSGRRIVIHEEGRCLRLATRALIP